MRTLKITISDQGVSVEASGFKGSGCLKASQAYEEALGQVSDRKPKPEMRTKIVAQQKADNG